jgi:hypothetical protein
VHDRRSLERILLGGVDRGVARGDDVFAGPGNSGCTAPAGGLQQALRHAVAQDGLGDEVRRAPCRDADPHECARRRLAIARTAAAADQVPFWLGWRCDAEAAQTRLPRSAPVSRCEMFSKSPRTPTRAPPCARTGHAPPDRHAAYIGVAVGPDAVFADRSDGAGTALRTRIRAQTRFPSGEDRRSAGCLPPRSPTASEAGPVLSSGPLASADGCMESTCQAGKLVVLSTWENSFR